MRTVDGHAGHGPSLLSSVLAKISRRARDVASQGRADVGAPGAVR
ncbi:MAG TPA: hypothetical protein VE569_04000 [Acidimicrobiia bacterium]|nr:hypothetical protein [Acidimicrobiia bacterium]